jgi:hypothetical protein
LNIVTRIFVLAEHSPERIYHGSAFIRLIQPLLHRPIPEDFDVQFGYDLPEQKFDIVITERFWCRTKTIADVRALIHRIKRQALRFIYELDDNLLDLAWDEPWHGAITEEKRAIVRLFLREADVAMVSTPPLERRVQHICRRTFVVPNAIDETLFPPAEAMRQKLIARSENKTVTFGYMGTPTHTQDLMMILEPLRGILRTYGERVEFQIAQATHDLRVRQSLDGLPYTVLDVGRSGDYKLFVGWEAENLNWDFGIGPLTSSPLNDSKSDLKFLEYGVLGIPGVFSAGPSYSPSVIHERTGLVCANDPRSWYESMALMIENGNLRRELAANVLRYVHRQRTLKQQIGDWRTVLQAASGSRPVSSSASSNSYNA